MRTLVTIACLLATPALADEAAAPQVQLEEKRAALEKLRDERDAAQVKANIYVLPQHKLEVIAKQEEMDAVQKALDALEREVQGSGGR